MWPRDSHRAEHIAPEQLIVSSDCGFGRQGANREIAFYKASAIAQGAIWCGKSWASDDIRAGRRPTLQMDIVPKTAIESLITDHYPQFVESPILESRIVESPNLESDSRIQGFTDERFKDLDE
jgi:hypothetical protein